MVIKGHIENNQVVIDEDIQLPEGTEVKISVIEKNNSKSSGLCGIWKDDRSTNEIIEDIISTRSEGRDVNL